MSFGAARLATEKQIHHLPAEFLFGGANER